MKKWNVLVATFALLAVSSANATDACVIKISREACPGKEIEALKPYNGKKETEETKQVGDEAACTAFAEKSSKIVRKGTLSAKRVIASVGGKDLGKTFEDKKECK